MVRAIVIGRIRHTAARARPASYRTALALFFACIPVGWAKCWTVSGATFCDNRESFMRPNSDAQERHSEQKRVAYENRNFAEALPASDAAADPGKEPVQ